MSPSPKSFRVADTATLPKGKRKITGKHVKKRKFANRNPVCRINGSTMFSRLKLYIFIGCIVVAAGICAMFAFHTKFQSQPPSSPLAPHRVLPETPMPDSYFKLTIKKSDTIVDQSAGRQKMGTDVELKYAHQKTNDGIMLTFYSMEVKQSQDGASIEGTLMARDRLVNQEGYQKTESSFDELPQKWQAGLAAAFATNFCKIILDTNQNELGRQMLSGDGFGLIGEENLDLVRLMHGPYHPGADHWQSTNQIPTTHAFVMDCPVAYARINGAGNEISVNGSFTNNEMSSSQNDEVFKNVSCSIAGKETFDETANEYTSGEMTLQYKFLIFQGGAQVAAFDREMELSLGRVTTRDK